MDQLPLKARLKDIANRVSGALDRLLLPASELRLRRRDALMEAMMRRGATTGAEILQADFGTAHPAGLDIVSPPADRMRLVNLEEWEGLNSLGPAARQAELDRTGGLHAGGDRLFLHPYNYKTDNPRSLVRYRSNTIAHEYIHHRQWREMQSGWLSTYNRNEDHMSALMTPLEGAGTWQTVKRLYQKFNQKAADYGALKRTKFQISNYYAQEREMQARLHEMMAEGYAQWQRLPVSKIELWAALHNIGLETPATVMTALRDSDEGRRALRDFRVENNVQRDIRKEISDFNRIDDYLSLAERRGVLWEKIYPFLYGNLLEHYGDGPGRARMGLGSNPAAAKYILGVLQRNPVLAPADEPGILAAAVPPDRANELINAIMVKYPDGAPGSARAFALVDALLARPAVLQALKENQGTWDAMLGYQGRPALLNAVEAGHKSIAGRLARAGIDPGVPCRVANILGDSVDSHAPLDYCYNLRLARQIRAGEMLSPEDQALHKDEAKRRNFLRQMDKMRPALQAVAENYPRLDETQEKMDMPGWTARQMLENAGIAVPPPRAGSLPSSPFPARPEPDRVFFYPLCCYLINMSIELTTLANGLRVITDAVTSVDSVALGVWADVGTRDEERAHNGVAHMVEHMMFKGTKRRDAVKIAEEVEDAGGQINAWTSREMTAYHIHLLRDDMPLALDILADLLQHSTLPEEEIVRERQVILQEIGMTADTPDDLVFDHYQEKAYPGQAIGDPILGHAKIVASMARDTMTDYIRRFYTPARLVVSAAGNVKHDEFVAQVQKQFNALPPSGDIKHMPARYEGGDVRVEKVLEQSHIVLGFQGISRHEDGYYAAVALATILGGGMSSRLFQEVREKRGLAYSVFSFHSSYQDDGQFGIYTGTGPESLPELMPVLCDEIKKACHTIRPEELARAKAQMKAALLMSRESMMTRAGQQAKQLINFETVLNVQEKLAQLEATTVQGVQDMAARIFAGKPTLAALGPIKGLESYDSIARRLVA